MNKTFQKIFAKAKAENRSCFVAFVTGMDPDYESSKQILIELSSSKLLSIFMTMFKSIYDLKRLL